MTPTQRSMKLLRERGYEPEIVERWCPHSRRRKDLFGFIDIIALRAGEPPLLVQTTSGSGASRVSKIREHENLPLVLASNMQVVVHGWRKLKVKRGGKAMRWAVREIHITDE